MMQRNTQDFDTPRPYHPTSTQLCLRPPLTTTLCSLLWPARLRMYDRLLILCLSLSSSFSPAVFPCSVLDTSERLSVLRVSLSLHLNGWFYSLM
ncbi:hypothetical protein BDR04DRAFT_12529 [Suillus decipiens]|nr:hypothetical protein BDR04DRAFT_12529 [Suillus decipiens]